MFFHTRDLASWNRVSLGFGGCAWGMATLASVIGWLRLSDLQIVLLLALFVITPLAMTLVLRPKEDRSLPQPAALMLFMQPLASLLGGTSFFLPMGLFAAAFAAIWLFFTVLLALIGLVRLCQFHHQQLLSLANLCLTGAWLYLPIGSTWMLLARWGLQPLGFGVHTDLLTAVHFHFIALAALIITGLTGQMIQTTRITQHKIFRTTYRIAALGVLIDPLLVAAGLTMAQVANLPSLDTAPADLLALSLLLISLLGLRFVVPTTTSRLAQVLLTLSYTTIFFTMLFAGAYALGDATGAWTITIPQMILIHGLENALGFGFCGLLGWRIRSEQRKMNGEACA
ncbi:YndJ family transporter [Dictyobacter aurantiacus]|uniref:YndJ-like protein n=1 Tax=Dictyobacter aurantiacus TaxID=1936993 RepID=A0A401ZSJ5_9CHLR|nr:YndJ family transporter [Dictyobacter aurantiacus]GCE09831.1 hypothetical protein KDAU_71600 [Dictyobacter aurantiacus]